MYLCSVIIFANLFYIPCDHVVIGTFKSDFMLRSFSTFSVVEREVLLKEKPPTLYKRENIREVGGGGGGGWRSAREKKKSIYLKWVAIVVC